MTEFGAGIYLDDEFDLEVSESGDLRTTIGLSEVEKDLAFKSTQRLQPILGSPKTQLVASEIERIITTITNNEPRVGRVTDIDVFYPDDRRNTVSLDVRLIVSDQDQPLVFSVIV